MTNYSTRNKTASKITKRQHEMPAWYTKNGDCEAPVCF